MTQKHKLANRIPLETRLHFADYLFRNNPSGYLLRGNLEKMVAAANRMEIPIFSDEQIADSRKAFRSEVGFAESELHYLAKSISGLVTPDNQEYVHRVRSTGLALSRNTRQEKTLILNDEQIEKLQSKKAQFIPSYFPTTVHDPSEQLEVMHDIFYMLPFPKQDNTPLLSNDSDIFQVTYRMKKIGIKSTVKILGLEKNYSRDIPENITGKILDGWGIRIFLNHGFSNTEAQNKCYDAREQIASLFHGEYGETRFKNEKSHTFQGSLGTIIDSKDYFSDTTGSGYNALYLTVISRTGQACEIQFLTNKMFNRNEDSSDSNKREYKENKYVQYFKAMDKKEKEIFYHVMKNNFIMFEERKRKSQTEVFHNFEYEVKVIREVLKDNNLSGLPQIWKPNERIIY